MALPRRVLGDQDVARTEPLHRAVADLDVDGSGEREHRIAPANIVRDGQDAFLGNAHGL